MSSDFSPDEYALIEEVADRFEQNWSPTIQIDDFVGFVPEKLQSKLRSLLVKIHERLLSVHPTNPPLTHETPSAGPAIEPARIGRYAVTRRLHGGGFGIVYIGYDDQMQRSVAIKIPSPKLLATSRSRERFLEEARAVANLHHENIVPIWDMGEDERAGCFLVYRFIEGCDLAARLRQGRIPNLDLSVLLADVADALHFAHQRGVFHRDIKPPNILIDAAGKAYVTDFGLAVRDDELERLRGAIEGTFWYMSPEQVRGESHRIDGRSDIFGLGVVLYETLTGRRPFHATTRDDLFDQIEHLDPRPPRAIEDSIPRQLERICLKALSKRRAERYNTAADMAEDLRLAAAEILERKTPSSGQRSKAVLPGTESRHQELGARAERPVPAPTAQPQVVVQVQLPPEAVKPGLAQPVLSPAGPIETPVGTHAPTPTEPPGSDSAERMVQVSPRGLRSFDPEDKDFFLELVPGIRDREGVPDSIGFWKTRIENRDREQAFPVGLIYGPSGCGKSSLFQAGLRPRLASHVSVVYVECTRDDTERRLSKSLRHIARGVSDQSSSEQGSTPTNSTERQHLPALEPEDAPLSAMIKSLRRRETAAKGAKVLVVLDQFEQWLDSHSQDLGRAELVDALRQADGVHVQFILMVRDDFWVTTSRLFQELDIPLVEGHNYRLVDLFDLRHARRVLQLFGQAYACLPQRASQFSPDQNAYLDRAVELLSENGKVICVRLSLFAELMKARPWLVGSLKGQGGPEILGYFFLQDTFCARTANPDFRDLEKPARALLCALLPETGSTLKGRMRSRAELLQLSGVRDPKRFARLLHVLDQELRLITPTLPEEGEARRAETESRQEPAELKAHGAQQPTSTATESGWYQITHDFIVPSLRRWLRERDRRTFAGRARIALDEHTDLWERRGRRREDLPSYLTTARILRGTNYRTCTPTARKMIWAACFRQPVRRLSTLVFFHFPLVELLSYCTVVTLCFSLAGFLLGFFGPYVLGSLVTAVFLLIFSSWPMAGITRTIGILGLWSVWRCSVPRRLRAPLATLTVGAVCLPAPVFLAMRVTPGIGVVVAALAESANDENRMDVSLRGYQKAIELQPEITPECADSLIRLGDPGRKVLLDLLRHPTPEVRAAIAAALPKLKGEAVDPLVSALNDDDNTVQKRAVSALAELEGVAKRALPKLIELMEDDQTDSTVRARTAVAYWKIRESPGEEVRDPWDGDGALTSSYYVLRMLAERRTMSTRERVAEDALPAVPHERLLPHLLNALEDGDEAVRTSAVGVLRDVASKYKPTINKLAVSLNHPSHQVRTGAAEILSSLVFWVRRLPAVFP